MKFNTLFQAPCLLLFFCYFFVLNAQLEPNAYRAVDKSNDTLVRQLLIDKNYFVLTVYEESPAKFIKTLGGFYETKDNSLVVKLEFNSDFKADGLKELNIPFRLENGQLVLSLDTQITFTAAAPLHQELDGKWLMAGRVADNEEQRRDTTTPRKTMKILNNGHFQWIAFHTETFDFSGTGGGTFTSTNGAYTEHLGFFSRDDSRVGASLAFAYNLKGNDWHHVGKSSKGDPLHEIWARRLE